MNVSNTTSHQQIRFRRILLVIDSFAVHETVIIAIANKLIVPSTRLEAAFLDANAPMVFVSDESVARPENIGFNTRIHMDGPQDERNGRSVEDPNLIIRSTGSIAEAMAAIKRSEVRPQARGHGHGAYGERHLD